MRWSLEDRLDILARQEVDAVLHYQGQFLSWQAESKYIVYYS